MNSYACTTYERVYELRGDSLCFHDCLIQRNAAISVKAPALSQDTHPTKTQKKTTKNNANYLAMKPAFITMFRAGTEGRPKIKEGKVKRKSETNQSMGIVGELGVAFESSLS